MVFKKFQTQVIIRVLLILGNSIWLSFEMLSPPFVYTIIFLGTLLIIQSFLLIRYVNRRNRELNRIFTSLWDQDTSFTLAPNDQSGTFGEIAGIINETRQQIQEARISKEKHYRYLQFILNHMDIGLLSFHGDGRVEHYNRAAGKLLASPELSVLKSLNALHPDFEITLQEMEPGQSKILTLSPGGESVQALIRMTQFVYEDHPLKLVSLQDVRTELDEQELISWKRLIRVLNHEVLNSLTPIRTLTHAIDRSLEEFKPEIPNKHIIKDIRKNTSLIAKRSASLSDFVNRYREITRIQEISLQKIHMGALLQEVNALFRKEFSGENIRCLVDINPPELQLEGDENLLKQVLINLVRNSMDALKNRSDGTIHMKAKKEENHILLTIEDNGPGIPAEYLGEIFTPFFSTREDGSGIGLSFSKHIVRLHGGHISIQSKPGEGTSLTMKFKAPA